MVMDSREAPSYAKFLEVLEKVEEMKGLAENYYMSGVAATGSRARGVQREAVKLLKEWAKTGTSQEEKDFMADFRSYVQEHGAPESAPSWRQEEVQDEPGEPNDESLEDFLG